MASKRKKTPKKGSSYQKTLFKLSGGIALILAIFCWFSGTYALPRHSERQVHKQIIIWLSSPEYLSVNEEAVFRFSLKNSQGNAILANFRLDSNDTIPAFIELEGTNIFWDGIIKGNEQVDRQVNVFIPFDFGGGNTNHTLGKKIGLTLWGKTGIQPFENITEISVHTAPIPWPKTLFFGSLSTLSSLLLWVAKEWWDTTRKELGQER